MSLKRLGASLPGMSYDCIIDGIRTLQYQTNSSGAAELLEPGDYTLAVVTWTAVTNADPGVFTSTAHGRSTGDWVYFENVGGMTELNQNYYKIEKINNDSFSLKDRAGDDIDTTDFGVWTSGGTLEYSEGGDSGNHPLTGSDGVGGQVAPNHGPKGGSEADVIGYWPVATQWDNGDNQYNGTELRSIFDAMGANGVMGDSGYDVLARVHVSNPASNVLTGVIIQGASKGSAVGYGTLTYTYHATNPTLQWTPRGGTIGSAIDVGGDGSDFEDVDGVALNERRRTYKLPSGESLHDWDDVIYAYVIPANLPGQNETYEGLCVTATPWETVHQYAGIAGDYSIVTDPSVTPPDSGIDPPTAPGKPAVVEVDSTHATFTFDASTAGAGAVMTSYEISYSADGGGSTFMWAEPAAGTDPEVVTVAFAFVEGVSYTFTVVGLDNSSPSLTSSASTASDAFSISATNLVQDSEFSDGVLVADPADGWAAMNANTGSTWAAGVIRIYNIASEPSAGIRQYVTGLSASTNYKAVVSAKKSTSKLNLQIDSTGYTSSGADFVDEQPIDTVLTENEYAFSTGVGETEAYIQAWVWSTSAGQGFECDHIRIVPA